MIVKLPLSLVKTTLEPSAVAAVKVPVIEVLEVAPIIVSLPALATIT